MLQGLQTCLFGHFGSKNQYPSTKRELQGQSYNLNFQGGSFYQTFSPYSANELLLFEFDRANAQFFKGLKLVCMVNVGQKINT